MNFGTGFRYPFPGTNHYCTGSVSKRQRNKDSKIGVNIPQGWSNRSANLWFKNLWLENDQHCPKWERPTWMSKRPMLSTVPVRLFRITNTTPRKLSSASKWPSECHRKACVHCPMSMSILYKAEGKTAICWIAVCLSLIHIWRCRRIERCRSRWSPYH